MTAASVEIHRGVAARDSRDQRETTSREMFDSSWTMLDRLSGWDQPFLLEHERPGWNGMITSAELLAHAELANHHAAVARWRGLPRRNDALSRWRGLAEE